MKLSLKKINPQAILPTKKNPTDAGVDVYACGFHILEPGVPKIIPIGWQVANMDKGYQIEVRSRSGNTVERRFIVANQPGTIDNGYRGEIGIILVSLHEQVSIAHGDKIAQLVPMLYHDCEICVCDEITDTERGANGFGSSGK